jgi:cytochrome c551/c552
MNCRLAATIVGAGLWLVTGSALAQDAKLAEAKAKEAGCLGCHAVAAKKVGPAFREVAKKYPKQGDKIVAALKADKDHADAIKDVKSDDLKLIADWIGSL